MRTIDPILRCARCGEVIGVYEPLVVVQDGGPRDSSLAAEPALAGAPGELYHQGCHVVLAQQLERTRSAKA